MKRRIGCIVLLVGMLVIGCDSAYYPYYLSHEATSYETIDFLIIRYYWEASSGTDLDTRTALINPNRGIDVGWSRNSTDSTYLTWGLDNTASGYEAVLLNIDALRTDFPDNDEFDIRMRAFWYGSRSSGRVNIEFTGYLGGEMVREGYNWVNEGGREVRSIDVERTVFTQQRTNINGDDLGIARYHVNTRRLEILDP